MRCSAWVCNISGGPRDTHRDGVRLVVASADANGRTYSSTDATAIKANLKVANKVVKLGRVRRCEGSLLASIEMVKEYIGTPMEGDELQVRWVCSVCGCSFHQDLPTSKEELTNYLTHVVSLM